MSLLLRAPTLCGLRVYCLVCFQCKPLSIQLISKASSFPDVLAEYVSPPHPRPGHQGPF